MTLIKSTFSSPFRPFFIGAALISALVPIFWILNLTDILSFETTYSSPLSWHIHEMLFGFTWALFGGFLLTASANWTGKKAITGNLLIFLLSTWLVARFTPLLTFIPFEVTVFINILSTVMINACFLHMVRKNRNRNIVGPLVFVLMLAQSMFLLSDLYGNDFYNSYSIRIGMTVIFHLIIIMSGRLTPMFTRNALALNCPSPTKINNFLAIAPLSLLYFPEDTIPPSLLAAVLIIAGVTHLYRCFQWNSLKTLSMPLVSILHFGQLIVGLYFLVEALFALGHVDQTLRTHFFTLGVLGVFSLGMLLRVSKGHTGRLFETSIFDNLILIMVILAFVLRSVFPVFLDDYVDTLYMIASTLWFLSYGLFVVKYIAVLSTPRFNR